MKYWKECIQEALHDVAIIATDAQITVMADAIRIAHENYGMAHGHDCIPNPLKMENEKLKRELDEERDLTGCPHCNGRGLITEYWLDRSSTFRCNKCHGGKQTADDRARFNRR